MKSIKENNIAATGFAIALAWPQTTCKQAGAWYDGLMRLMGFNRDYFYKAGHAALVLVEESSGICHYFDFGRYHSPYAHGRVRSKDTDHDVEVKTRAIISDGKIENFNEILQELFANESCHGTGALYGSYRRVKFGRAYNKAIEMQDSSPIIYGPFIKGGTNCSRFVSSVIREGLFFSWSWFKITFFVPATPTPLSNVKNLAPFQKITGLSSPGITSQHLKYA